MDALNISYKNAGSYPVVIEKDYSSLGALISEMFPQLKRICIVTDTNVSNLYLDNIKSALSDCCEIVTEYIFEAGECSKTLDTVKASD